MMPAKIAYDDKLLLIGSCFTEHIGKRFKTFGWKVCENPSGVIFNPNSIYKIISRIVNRIEIENDELVYQNELWHHWDFHSRFSNTNKDETIQGINESIHASHDFLKKTDWIFFTLGSSFQYFTNEHQYGVSNCHRFPASAFYKEMLSIDDIKLNLHNTIELVRKINPQIKIIFTISPVRHIKDGIVENNLSKARLIESVHSFTDQSNIFYYPAYEILIDVLRDYRYYDTDLVHPNFAATQYVWEYLVDNFLDEKAKDFLSRMIVINDGYNHRTRFPETKAHFHFINNYLKKIEDIRKIFPNADFQKYEEYFMHCRNYHPLFTDIS